MVNGRIDLISLVQFEKCNDVFKEISDIMAQLNAMNNEKVYHELSLSNNFSKHFNIVRIM